MQSVRPPLFIIPTALSKFAIFCHTNVKRCIHQPTSPHRKSTATATPSTCPLTLGQAAYYICIFLHARDNEVEEVKTRDHRDKEEKEGKEDEQNT